MLRMFDLVASLLLLAFGVSMLGAYAARGALFGHTKSLRLEGAGSVLMGRFIMEMAYWTFEPVVRLLLRLRVTPNMITAASLVPAFLSGTAVAMGHMGVGAVLATLSAFSDMLDGIVARRRGVSSDAGEVFDAAVDRYVEFFLLAGLVVHYRGHVILMLLSLGAILGSFMVSYATAKAEALGVDPPKGAMRRPERAMYLLFGATFVPVVAAVVGTGSNSIYLADLPMVLAVSMVAVVANVSAARRLYRTAQLVRQRKGSPP